MVLGFVCCSNPSGSTNNNTLDNCNICDGVQDESHEHDYCLECDGVQGSDHEHQVVTPTEPTWFKEATIGGENSSFSFMYADCNEIPDFGDAKTKANTILEQYKKYVESFSLDNELSNVTLDQTVSSFDDLIGSINNNYYAKDGLNDVCAPAMEKIAKNIGITDNDQDISYFYLYLDAILNEGYKYGYNGENAAYTAKKDDIKESLENNNDYYNTNYSIYQETTDENGNTYDTIHPDAIQQFDNMVVAAANKLGITTEKARAVINYAIAISSAEGLHDLLSATLLVNDHTHNDMCPNNEMIDVVYNVEVEEMTPIAKAKLNKSIFNNKTIDRELC